ncbi:MAG: metallophosphoesterase [Thermotogae bacterium]|nr:metallophosphoesterase [Thermotogota bacterium]
MRYLVICFLLASFLSTMIFPFELKIYFSNDVHERLYHLKDGSFVGLLGFPGLLKKIDRKNTLVLDGGDFFHDEFNDPFFWNIRKNVESLAKEINYDAMIPGNHEYMYGKDWLENYMRGNDKLIGANIKGVSPYKIFDFNDFRIAVIGLTTNQYVAGTAEYTPNELPQDPIRALHNVLQKLPLVDYVIVLEHLQIPLDLKIFYDFPRVDLILSGHDHTGPTFMKAGNRYYYEGAPYAYPMALLTLDTKTREVNYVPIYPEISNIKRMKEISTEKWQMTAVTVVLFTTFISAFLWNAFKIW